MSARPAHFDIPDMCNTTAVALVVLFSELLVVILLFIMYLMVVKHLLL